VSSSRKQRFIPTANIHPKALLITLFIALATASPAPGPDAVQVTENSLSAEPAHAVKCYPKLYKISLPCPTHSVLLPFSSNERILSYTTGEHLKPKTWEAKGGCEKDWDQNTRCKNQCVDEAKDGMYKNYKSMTSYIVGGCWFGRVRETKCRCVCEHWWLGDEKGNEVLMQGWVRGFCWDGQTRKGQSTIAMMNENLYFLESRCM
jgi:hypothetical protein